MPQCELCGKEVDELTKTKISGAEIQVCSNCTSLGTTVGSESSSSSDTKYSTDTSSNQGSSEDTGSRSTQTSTGTTSTETGGGSSSPSNPFDDVSDLAVDYGQKIQSERSRQELSREDLAQDLGIKESYLRNIENEDTQPSVELQNKIERNLDIDLSQSDELGM